MSVQSINSSNNPYLSNIATDLLNLQNLIQPNGTAQSTQSTGTGAQDQVSLSQDALQQALTQLQNDVTDLEQSPQAQGHHHHHHHHQTVDSSANGTNTSANNSTNNGNAVSSSSFYSLLESLTNDSAAQTQIGSTINMTV
jgi:hypothetical protein